MTVPPVAPEVVPAVLDALPPRLRKRIDGALDRAREWVVEVVGDAASARIDADTVLSWTLHSGVLIGADELVCSCLLAPKCLHRGIAVAVASVAEVQPRAADVVELEDDVVVGEKRGERAAAEVLWGACAEILRVGVTGSGAVVRSELLRAVHGARLVGLHRAAAGGVRIATGLAAAKAGASSFDRETLADDLTEVMLVCHDLRSGIGDPVALRGTARREYQPVGALRLYGLCTEAVLTSSGYAGVVTHVVAADRTLWTVPSVYPGGVERIVIAADGPVAMGETGLSHRQLGRSGLVLSGATAAPDRRLGAGRAVRAVAAAGATWDEQPVAGLWDEPLADQLTRALHTGQDLVFLSGVVSGATTTALRLRLDTGDIDLLGATDAARDNLRLLGERPGLPLRVVARLVPDRPATAVALAAAGELAVTGHVDLTIDRLQRSHLPPGAPAAALPAPAVEPPPSGLLATVVDRVVLGGRPVAALPSTTRDAATLARAGLTATAALLDTLATTARTRARDPFGRAIPDPTDAFPTAWLTAALHTREFTRAAVRLSWLPPEQGAN
ncbi:hypothetical protein [Actinokineospora cianjurensis]|uniref:SWIM-type domain-containing protein n=1 Tax=Actinokineospora cianjurensis TaxID=585224 RepID=A0A421AX14_9PSEU|nr:hypothetical protein [Actinokineospora cianjurensis]RLK54375.1 hypothetical protein CLV68_5925 [Actinokineospora cianjurensis]